MTSTDDAIAAFLARGGKVQKVEPDARALDDREIYLAERGRAPREKTDNELIEERHVRAGVVYNGLGEVIGTL